MPRVEIANRDLEDVRVTAAVVLAELGRRNFAVLSTIDGEGRPDSAGVNYGLSVTESGPAIYIMTRRHLRKARNIASNPNVALVVPLMRRFLWFLPPATIQLHGRAELLDWSDEAGTAVFRRFWIGRRILDAYAATRRRGDARVCFLRITPDPVVRTYMVGFGARELRNHMESGAAKVVIGSARPQ